MNFTFAICHGKSPVKKKKDYIHQCISSIRDLHIPEDKYEIIIAGDKRKVDMSFSGPDTIAIDFDDNQKSGRWITRKKNLMTDVATFDNIVYIHNYVIFNKDWYKGFLEFGNNFDICTTHVFNSNNTENYTWLLNPYFEKFRKDIIKNTRRFNEYTIPKDVTALSKLQYMPGNYWVAKKEAMKQVPLDERLLHAESEDCEWSLRASLFYDFKFNSYSSVRFLREDRTPSRPRAVIGDDIVDYLVSLSDDEILDYHKKQRENFRKEWLHGKKFLDEM